MNGRERKQHSKVVFLVESPFSRRDEQRFGLYYLRQWGLEIEVWDVGNLTLPKARRQWIEKSLSVIPIEVGSFEQLQFLSSKIDDSVAVLLICCVYGDLADHDRQVLRILSTTCATLGAISSAHLPKPFWSHKARYYLDLLMENKRGRLISGARRLGQKAAVPGIRRSISRIIKAQSGSSQHHIRPLDHVWCGTMVTPINPMLVTTSTSVQYIHTLDYDRVLDLAFKSAEVSGYSIFLDAMGPLHPDYVTLGIDPQIDVGSYGECVARYLDRLEEHTGIPVLIAAHPRAKPNSLNDLYGGRYVHYGDNTDLIASAALVSCASDSAAIGIAVALRRPLSFLADMPHLAESRMNIRSYSKWLHLGRQALMMPRKNWKIPSVNEKAYANYERRFMKVPGSPRQYFWDIVARDLTGN